MIVAPFWHISARRLAAVALLAPATGLMACGGSSGERVFAAQELVDAIDAHGAGIALGPLTSTDQDGEQVYEISFAEISGGVSSPDEPAPAASRSGGTLLLAEDADAARDEFARCQRDPTLTCFRAANATLRFERLEGADQARLVTALEAIQTVAG